MDFSELPLRDIHLPDAVSWFPPGPGIWMLVALAGLLLVAIYWFRRRTLRRAALAEYARIETRFRSHGNEHRLASDLSELVRRVAIARADNRGDVAGLTGDAWLRYLARTTPALASQRMLLTAPYQRATGIDAEALLDACRDFCAGRRGGT